MTQAGGSEGCEKHRMTQDSKIARLPQGIREQINRRLQNGGSAKEIGEWVNTQSEVKALMAAEFEGAPIVEANLVSWKVGGYRHWEEQQQALEAAVQFGENAAEIAQAAGGQLADHLALCMTARIAVALRKAPGAGEDAAGQLQRLRQLVGDLVALRKGDQSAQWLRIEREKLDSELRKFEEEEAARKRQLEKPKIDYKTYHASQEVHDQVAAMLKRI
jgi:hypothetical protein